MTQYDKYQKLMSSLDYTYDGIKLNHVMALEIWAVAAGKSIFSWRSASKCFFKYNIPYQDVSKSDGLLVSFGDIKRKDHQYIFKGVIERLSVNPPIINFCEVGKKLSFQLLSVIKMFSLALFRFKNAKVPLSMKIKIAGEFACLINTINDLKQHDWHATSKYLCMCHVIGLENLLTQFFRLKGVRTYSLEEGVYIVMKKQKVLGCIAYELFATDNLLCWGQYTKDEYTQYGIESNRISVAGYPKRVHMNDIIKSKCNSCLVMLAGPIFGDVNLQLLSILKQVKGKMSITLKSHPANHAEMEKLARGLSFDIVERGITVDECLKSGKYDMCIGVNTTAYYESWMAGIPCVRYGDERFDSYKGFDDEFASAEQLLLLIDDIKNKPKNKEEVCKMLEYAVGYGIDNYNKIITKSNA